MMLAPDVEPLTLPFFFALFLEHQKGDDNQHLWCTVKPQPGYNAIISACVKGDQWQQAVDFLEKMQKNKVIPNIISYNTAIAACKVSGESWAAQVSSVQKPLG